MPRKGFGSITPEMLLMIGVLVGIVIVIILITILMTRSAGNLQPGELPLPERAEIVFLILFTRSLIFKFLKPK